MIGAITAGLFSAGVPPTPLTDFVSIATVSVGAGGSAAATFSAIPSTYKHLQIRAIGRNDGAPVDARYTFNSDTGSNYSYHLLVGNGSTGASYSATSQTFLRGAPYADQTASIFGAGVTDILDYTNTNKYKTVRTLTGMDNNTVNYGQIQFYSGLWMNTAAITTITITPSAGTVWTQHSSFALYGIQG
jgi:hypothetical protein